MMLRLLALVLVAGLAGCTWESRPDGGDAVHSNATSDAPGEAGEFGPRATPLGGDLVDAEVIEPLDGAAGADAPIPTPQPAPTTDSSDAPTEADEAPTPGTDR